MYSKEIKDLAENSGIPADKLAQKLGSIDLRTADPDQIAQIIGALIDEQSGGEISDESIRQNNNFFDEEDVSSGEDISDKEIAAELEKIFTSFKPEKVSGIGEVRYGYKKVNKLDFGLTAEELLTLHESILDMLAPPGATQVNLSVYKRLKDDGYIKGDAFDLTNVKAYDGPFYHTKEHHIIKEKREKKLQEKKDQNQPQSAKKRLNKHDIRKLERQKRREKKMKHGNRVVRR